MTGYIYRPCYLKCNNLSNKIGIATYYIQCSTHNIPRSFFQICMYSADLYLGFAYWATFETLQNVFHLNNIVILFMFIHAYENVFTANLEANAQCIVAVCLRAVIWRNDKLQNRKKLVSQILKQIILLYIIDIIACPRSCKTACPH